MTWMFYLIDLIGNGLDELVAVSYFRSLSGKKPKSVSAVTAVCALFALFRLIPSCVLQDEILNIAATMLAFTAISLLYDLSWGRRLVFIPLLNLQILFSEMLVAFLLTAVTGISVTEGRHLFLFYAGGVLISKMVLFSLLKIIQQLVPSFGERISGYLLGPLLLLPIATFLMLCVLGEYSISDGPSGRITIAAVALILMAFSNVALFFLLEYQQREEKEKNRMRMIQQQTEGQIAWYRELAERQQISNRTMHDLKNQMFALSEAMKTEPGRTREIMESISGKIFAASPMTITGIDAVDALIFTKKQQMELHGIRYEQSVYTAPGCSFDPLDLCVLLGNLLDNAIEANEKVKPEDRYVSLSMTQQECWLSITVKNAAAGAVPTDGKTIRTTKAHRELHGFGLSSVNEIAARYGGNCTFQSTDRDFTACLILRDG